MSFIGLEPPAIKAAAAQPESTFRNYSLPISCNRLSMKRRSGPLPAVADLSIDEVLEAIRRDKKVVNGRLHFVVAIEIGATMTVDDVTEEELRGVLRRLGLH